MAQGCLFLIIPRAVHQIRQANKADLFGRRRWDSARKCRRRKV